MQNKEEMANKCPPKTQKRGSEHNLLETTYDGHYQTYMFMQ